MQPARRHVLGLGCVICGAGRADILLRFGIMPSAKFVSHATLEVGSLIAYVAPRPSK